MTWGLFGQIVLLIIIYAISRTFCKCMHDSCCDKCRKMNK